MPPISNIEVKVEARPKIYVVCFFCKKPVGKIQERKGKAFCYGCQKAIFGMPKGYDKPQKRMMTPQEWIRRYRVHDD